MCMNCSGSKSSSGSKGGYTPKSKSAGKSSAPVLPKNWSTGNNSKSNNFGTPKVRATFGGRK